MLPWTRTGIRQPRTKPTDTPSPWTSPLAESGVPLLFLPLPPLAVAEVKSLVLSMRCKDTYTEFSRGGAALDEAEHDNRIIHAIVRGLAYKIYPAGRIERRPRYDVPRYVIRDSSLTPLPRGLRWKK